MCERVNDMCDRYCPRSAYELRHEDNLARTVRMVIKRPRKELKARLDCSNFSSYLAGVSLTTWGHNSVGIVPVYYSVPF